MSGSINVAAGGSYTITQTASYSPVTLALLSTLNVTGTSTTPTVATISDVSAALLDTFDVYGNATLDITNFLGVAAGNTYDIGNTGTLELGSGVNVDLLSAIDFTNTAGTSAALVLDPGLDLNILDSGINGFKSGSVIDLSGQTITGTSYDTADNTLTITTTNTTETLVFNGTYTNADFTFTGSDVIFACFAAGTLIATPYGPVPVEQLTEGDAVRVVSGAARQVKWVGRRHLDLRRFADAHRVHPIRILAGAFGDGLPGRDLVLSPDHALFIDGRLIAVRMLVNGMTVVRETECQSVTYYHIELDSHDVLLAEGLPAETYLDVGHRGLFENAGVALELHPDLGAATMRRAADSCAPFATEEAVVKPVWDRLVARARELGHALPAASATTSDPDLAVIADGRRLRPVSAADGRYVFMLPAAAVSLRLVSRSVIPADMRPWLDDRRRLGVAVRQMVVRHGAESLTLPADHPMFDQGWWPVEDDGHALWRWTDGSAVLGPLPARAILEIDVAALAPAYPAEADHQPNAALHLAA